MRLYPTGWRCSGFTATTATEASTAAAAGGAAAGGAAAGQWGAAGVVTSSTAELLPKKARAVSRSFQEKVAAILPITNATNSTAGRYRYVGAPRGPLHG